jgi:cellobiose epimerase
VHRAGRLGEPDTSVNCRRPGRCTAGFGGARIHRSRPGPRRPVGPRLIDGFTPDWKPIDNPRHLRASYGHDVERAWLCLDAAQVLGHPKTMLRGWAEGLVGYSLKHGYDRILHGGFFYTRPLGKDADDTKKEWWVQAEALVSMLGMYRLTGKSDYHDAFAQTLDFVEKHQVAKEGS